MKTAAHSPVSPRAQRTMRQRGIDSAFVRGTGPGGRIVEADVLLAAVMPKQTTKHSATVGSISPMRRAVATKVAESFA